MKIKKIKQFRLREKNFFLTYPKLDKNIEFLKEEGISSIKIKIETYWTLFNRWRETWRWWNSYSLFFELKTSLDTVNVNYLDLKLENKIYHGNYQIGKKKFINWIKEFAEFRKKLPKEIELKSIGFDSSLKN